MNIRHGDDPRFKEPLIAELYSKFITFLESEGLTKGKEFEGTIQELLSCSRRIIHVYDMDNGFERQLVIILRSTQLDVEFGIGNKRTKETEFKEKIELRYKISNGTQAELTDGSQEKFNKLFETFRLKFKEITEQSKCVKEGTEVKR